MNARPPVRQQIAAWATPERKGQFAALAASRGLSESKLLGLLIDSVLERNPADAARDVRQREAEEGIASPFGCAPAMDSGFDCERRGAV